LNIIAFRMARLHPNSLLTLRGSGQRSAEIRDYLHEAWGIALGRIRAEPSRESEGGANRSRNRSESVVLLTDTPSLFDPVELSARRANVDPPRIQLTPAFESGAGIQEWKIRIAHEGESVGEYSSQSAADGTAQINWRIAAGGASGKMTTLLAELRVRDSSGAVTTAAAQLPLHVVRIERVTELTISVDGKVMQGRWSLPKSMFSNQSGERFEERVIGEVAAAATAGSRIEIAIPEGDPTAEAWGKRVAAKLHDNRAAAGMRCTITTKAATLPSGAVEIRVRKSQ